MTMKTAHVHHILFLECYILNVSSHFLACLNMILQSSD